MDIKTKRLIAGSTCALYVFVHIAADKEISRNTKPITMLSGAISVPSTTNNTIVSGGMPDMMSSQDKTFSTRPVELTVGKISAKG